MLSDPDADRVQAAVDGIAIFVDTLVLVTDTQAALSAPAGDGSQDGAAPMDADGTQQVLSALKAVQLLSCSPHVAPDCICGVL